jgi:RNA polymerase sigma factor (TIGR02999 family)
MGYDSTSRAGREDTCPPPITELLNAAGGGDGVARERLWALVDAELRQIAQRQLRHEHRGRTLQPTALINEVYLRLTDSQPTNWESRRHFFGVAAKIMRCIRVDSARRRKRLKRGGDRRGVSLDSDGEGGDALGLAVWSDDDPSEALALEEALKRLEQFDPRKGELVMLRFYAGLTREEIGEMLGIAPRTVDKEWALARAWLHRELNSEL